MLHAEHGMMRKGRAEQNSIRAAELGLRGHRVVAAHGEAAAAASESHRRQQPASASARRSHVPAVLGMVAPICTVVRGSG
jgi:hypothetical protein